MCSNEHRHACRRNNKGTTMINNECPEWRYGDLEAVVFDWAGTTVDFGCQGPLEAFVESFAAFGVDVTRTEAREPMGMKKRDHVAAMFAMPRIARMWQEHHGAPHDEHDIDTVYALVEETMIAVIRRHSVPIPGTLEAVAELRRLGLRIGSCTGYPRVVAELLAERAKEFGYEPDVLVCATDVPAGRPAPDMCKEVLARLGIADPARAVKIGDTVNDVLEGLHAGMWVIGLTLSGSLAGLSQEEIAALSPEDREALHHRISHTLTTAGAHFTAVDVQSCLPLLQEIEKRS